MRALVTGATGFIGGRLTERLVEAGHDVVVLARRPDAAARLGVRVVPGDLSDAASLEVAVSGADVVFHCAGLSADWGTWAEFERVNVFGAKALAEVAAGSPTLKRFVHVSTTDVYGYPLVACGDDGPTRDLGLPYNRSKLLGELAVRGTPHLPWTVIRPATVFGPRSKDFAVELAKLIADRGMVSVAKGAAPAGLLYVDNLVDAMLAAAEAPLALHQVYTVRDEAKTTWREYLDAMADGLGLERVSLNLPRWLAMTIGWVSELLWGLVRAKSRPVLTRHAVLLMATDQCYGIERAVTQLGFRSRVTFAEGLRRTVEWLQSPEGRRARGLGLDEPRGPAPG